MQNNWYIIYTKPKWEKKVASNLRKRKIESFLPLHYTETVSLRRIRRQEEPLFRNYVFAQVAEDEIFKLKNIDGVINVVYWKGEPAKIKHHEIVMLKEFVNHHENITLQKTKIDVGDRARMVDNSRYSVSGNVLTIKNAVAKINLPSLGFQLSAKVNEASFATENTFSEKELLFQS